MLPLGNPEQDGASLYLNNHGSHFHTLVSADTYRTASMHLARLISGHELFFFIYAAFIAYQIEGIHGGRINLDVGPRDDVLERSPLPYPLSRTVTLRSPLSPEAYAERLLTFQPRSAWSFLSASRGLRGQASAEEFRLEMANPQSQMVYAVGRFERVGGATSIRVLLPFKRWALISWGNDSARSYRCGRRGKRWASSALVCTGSGVCGRSWREPPDRPGPATAIA